MHIVDIYVNYIYVFVFIMSCNNVLLMLMMMWVIILYIFISITKDVYCSCSRFCIWNTSISNTHSCYVTNKMFFVIVDMFIMLDICICI